MPSLDLIVSLLDQEFELTSYGKDPSFSRFIPAAYESCSFDWKNEFEKDFTKRFNGLMLKGAPAVNKIYLAVFLLTKCLNIL